MKAALPLCIVSAFVSAVSSHCDAYLERQCYTKRHLGDVIRRDNDTNEITNTLYIDRNRNNIYYNMMVKSANKTKYYVRRISLDTEKTLDYVSWHLMDFAVDEDTGVLYLIEYSKNHIYTWDMSQYIIDGLLSSEEFDRIEFNKKLYYTIRSKKGIFFYENKTSTIVSGTENHYVDDFIVDRIGDIYFVKTMANTEAWWLRSGSNSATLISSSSNMLMLDKYRNAFLINLNTHAINRVNYTTERLDEIGTIEDTVRGIVFDNENNIIYAGLNEVYYLKRENKTSDGLVKFDPTSVTNSISKPSVNQSEHQINLTTVTPKYEVVFHEENNGTTPEINDEKDNIATTENTDKHITSMDTDIPTEDNNNLPNFLKRILTNYLNKHNNCKGPKLSKISSTIIEFN